MDSISEIIGCNLHHNFKPSSKESLKFVKQNVDIVYCAKTCLELRDCRHGWAYHAGNRKVRKT